MADDFYLFINILQLATVNNGPHWVCVCVASYTSVNMSDVYDELYRSSRRDRGTLYQLKNYFNHRNVTSNVKDSFNFNEEFLDFCCNGYTVLAAMHYMQTEHLNDTPSDFPESLQDKLIYLDRVAKTDCGYGIFIIIANSAKDF
ncbi:hypothetical protein ACJMK2_014767 [Sinanodonta woodiana]|uniref:Ubiquitin-like protease family profile domain-containing protein n=1 Tax=Sinanodonta woodiana TaxID=1069815 RepID=A0ABD3V1M6_SINWO